MKKVVAEFEGEMNAEVRQQEKLDMTKEKDFRRGEFSEKCTAKILHKWNNRNFEIEYLRKLEGNWQK